MSSIAKTIQRSKKTRRLGAGQDFRLAQYGAFEVDPKVECVRAVIPFGLMHVEALLEEEVCTFAEVRYARKSPHLPGRAA